MKHRQFATSPYSAIDELMASPSQPLPQAKRTYQLTMMHDALHDMRNAPNPGSKSWRVLSDAVNLLETLVTEGEAPRP